MTYVRDRLLGSSGQPAMVPQKDSGDWLTIADPAYRPPFESVHHEPPSPGDLEPNRRAIYNVRQGQYAEAAAILKSAASAEPGDPGERVSVLMNLGTVCRLLGDYATARQSLEAASAAARRLPGSGLLDARLLDQMGDVEADERRVFIAVRYYRQALAMKEEILGGSAWDVAVTLKKLGELYFRERRYNEAGAEFTRALKVIGDLVGWEHAAVAKQLQRLAHVYARQRKHGQSEQALQFALRLLGEKPPDDPEVIACLRMLSGSYRGLGRYQDAQAVLGLTEDILKHPTARRDITQYQAPRPPGPADYAMKSSPLHRDTI